MIKKLNTLTTGKKTYVVAALMVVFGVAGLILGQLEPEIGVGFILNGLGFFGLRHAR